MSTNYLMMSINNKVLGARGEINSQSMVPGYDIVHRSPSQCVAKEVVSFTPAFNSESALAEAGRLISAWNAPMKQETTSAIE